jgi:hypothetical protein
MIYADFWSMQIVFFLLKRVPTTKQSRICAGAGNYDNYMMMHLETTHYDLQNLVCELKTGHRNELK